MIPYGEHEPGFLYALNSQLSDVTKQQWIELVPSGNRIVGRDGRSWLNDRPETIITAFKLDGKDLVIDAEHSTEIKAPKGEPAPAFGWISELESRDGAVAGFVSWNALGRKAIQNKEYRYYSPVFIYEKHTGRVVKVSSVGLTNNPNLMVPALNAAMPTAGFPSFTEDHAKIAEMAGNTLEDILRWGGPFECDLNNQNRQDCEACDTFDKIAMLLDNTPEDIAKYGK